MFLSKITHDKKGDGTAGTEDVAVCAGEDWICA
jgi:hypothetical protein